MDMCKQVSIPFKVEAQLWMEMETLNFFDDQYTYVCKYDF
jgi:hypothetical protein